MKTQALAILLISVCTEVVGEDIPYREIGKVKPRHAKEIAASNWSIGAETMGRDFTIYNNWKTYLGPLGAKKARIQSGWTKTERKKGEYNWAWLDGIVHDMVEQGVEPWCCICYGNDLYEGGGGYSLGAGIPHSEEALAAWDAYVKALVTRYRNHIDEWEVWNEPHQQEEYVELFIRTAEIIKQVQPDATVILQSFGGVLEPCLNALEEQNKLELLDEVSFHPYTYVPISSYRGAEGLRKRLAAYAPHVEIFQGENGAPSKPYGFGAIGDYDWDEVKQAKWLLRRLMGDLGHDIRSSYFAMCDMKYPDKINYKGLLSIDDDKQVTHAKRGYYAMQCVTSIFDNTLTRIADANIEIGMPHPDRGYASFAYVSKSSGHLAVLWRWRWSKEQVVWPLTDWQKRNNKKPTTSSVGARPGHKSDMEYLEVRMPGIHFKEPVLVDMLTGRVFAIPESQWNQHDSGVLFHRVPVYDSVILVAEKALIPMAAAGETP